MDKLFVNRDDIVVKRSKRAFKTALIALVIAVVITVTICIAWFVYNEKVRSEMFSVEVVDKAFSMQHIKINVDGENQMTNEFTGLLPGSYFQFEVKLNRKVVGDLNIKMEFIGIQGDDFIGARSGLTFNMTQLFCVAPIMSDGTLINQPVFFDANVDGKLTFMSGIHMPAVEPSVTVFFMMKFSSEQIGYSELDESISKKEFLIDKILISLET